RRELGRSKAVPYQTLMILMTRCSHDTILMTRLMRLARADGFTSPSPLDRVADRLSLNTTALVSEDVNARRQCAACRSVSGRGGCIASPPFGTDLPWIIAHWCSRHTGARAPCTLGGRQWDL